MTIQLDVPDGFLLATGQPAEEFVREAKFLLGLKLFEMGRISSGQAALLAGVPRVEFLFRAGQMGVPVAELDEEEPERESNVPGETRDSLEILTETGFIGSGQAQTDLSERYKEELRKRLAPEHGDR